MSSGGRGRGYTGRHSRARPGERVEEPRTLPEPSPRAADVTSVPAAAASPPAERCEMSRARRSPAHSISESDLLDNISAEDDAVLKELLHVDDQFQPLLLLLEQFSPSEDGIQFNRKLRNFETTITNMCPDEARLQAAFASFRAAALLSPGAARRLAGVGASFTRQQRQQVLRSTLLNVVLQGTFAKLDILERANPLFLINAANLMGDYFSEARLCNGNKVHILASPLLQYMKALLASDDVRAHRSLATQLMQNGRELLSVSPSETEESILVHCPQLMQNGRELLSVSPAETEELGVRLRLRLLGALAPGAALWLLLAADMALNRFLPLPAALQHFYAQHLQLGAPDKPAYCEVGYGAWRRADTEPAPEDESKPRLRPILGAGAALKPADAEWRAARRREPGAWRPEDEEPAFDPSVLPPPLPRAYDYPPPTYDYNNYLQQGDGHYIRNQPYKEELALAELSVADGQPPDPSDPDDIPERATIADFEGPERTRVPDNDKLTDKVNNEIQKSRARPTENWRSGDEERPPRRTMRRGAEPEPEAEPEREPRRTAPDVPRHHKYWDHDDRCDKEY